MQVFQHKFQVVPMPSIIDVLNKENIKSIDFVER